MSAETKGKTRSARPAGPSYQQRVSEFIASRRGKMFGVAEVAALAGSCSILVLVLFSYLYFVVPARSRVASLENDRKQLHTNLQTLQSVVSKEENTKETVQRITTSLEQFETDFLVAQDQGRMDLYDELNQLIIKNRVRNTSGPTYTEVDPEGTKTTGGKNIATKWQSFYPGVVVMLTVEGQYENVRRFIRDVERSKQFVVINEVELQRARDTNAPVSVEGESSEAAQPAPGSGSRGSLVSLQLSMATYFKREPVQAAPATQE